MTGVLVKIVVVLLLLVGGLGLLLKEEVYQSGIRDGALEQTAQAAERSIDAERRLGTSRAALAEANASGKANIADLERRIAEAEDSAKAARAEADQARASAETPPQCPPLPPVPASCAFDQSLTQP